MGKLVFHYGAMNSGKSLELMKFRYNLKQAGQNVLTLLPDYSEDNRTISSRAMKEEIEPEIISSDVEYILKDLQIELAYDSPIYLLIDEVQFLPVEVIYELKRLAEYDDLIIHCYGLLTTCDIEMWETSRELLLLADKVEEIPSLCEECGERKAKFHVKSTGDQHDKDTYKSVCWDCWNTENGVLV